jgi:hypothetical protein
MQSLEREVKNIATAEFFRKSSHVTQKIKGAKKS